MGACTVDGKDGPTIESVEEMAGRFYSEMLTLVPVWKQRLSAEPGQLEPLEREVQAAFARGADLLLAGLIAVVMKQPEFAAASEETRSGHLQPLRRVGQPDDDVSGLYVELAQFGFGKGVTPGLQSRVARQAALCPSFELARQELLRTGLKLDVKTVRRITYECGDDLLRLRKHQLLLWRDGKLPAGSELGGQRVTVQIDGGRTKIRGPLRPKPPQEEPTDQDGLVIENAPGRSKKRPAQTFDAEWREPKLVTIFVHDERGRMVKHSQATLEGTFLGPDALAELVAMHLHRLGAAQALSITFASDGAQWIWDRIAKMVSAAKVDKVPIHEVLDCCHAAHHISLALAALGLTEKQRMPLYREHRKLLRNGQWRRVVEELSELAADEPDNEKLQTEIAYLRKHGEAGRLSYTHFRSLGIPIGSGAIESSIRRVINLRLKSNGMFWGESQAETMLQVRAQVISNRWDQRLNEMRELTRRDGRLDWKWEPQAMSCKSESVLAT
jgi:hypothetical protein